MDGHDALRRAHAALQADAPSPLRELRELRERAFAAFAAQGLPTARHESWRYTDVDALTRQPLAPTPAAAAETADAAVAALPAPRGRRLTLVDGRLQLGGAPLPEGVSVRLLAAALETEPGLVDEASERHPLVALNTAFIEEGLLVQITGATAQPLYVRHITTVGAMVHPRLVVRVAPGARATVIEEFSGDGFTNAVTELRLGAGARRAQGRLARAARVARHFGHVLARQARDSRLVSHSLLFGGGLVRVATEATLSEPGAECELDGLYLADGAQHLASHTSVEHAATDGRSRQRYRGILGGRASVVYYGRIHVHPGAQRTDARQANANLLLSDDAVIHAKPELEIYADDVKCAHGATVGRLDVAALFYLRARGIPFTEARCMLMRAFAAEVLDRLPVPELRARLDDELTARLAEVAA